MNRDYDDDDDDKMINIITIIGGLIIYRKIIMINYYQIKSQHKYEASSSKKISGTVIISITSLLYGIIGQLHFDPSVFCFNLKYSTSPTPTLKGN